jgi:membrane protein implicated in regulation of membrane protease activity
LAEKWHSGITMHKLSVGGGFIGLLFAAGTALIFVLGFPTLWYFVAFAAVLGIAVALFLKFTSIWRANRNKPLSIMTEADAPRAPVTRNSNAKPHLLQDCPGITTA